MKQNSPTRAQRQHSTVPADDDHALHHHAHLQAHEHHRQTGVARNTPGKSALAPAHAPEPATTHAARGSHIFYPHREERSAPDLLTCSSTLSSSSPAVEMQAKLDTVNNVGVGSSPPPAVAVVLADPPHRCHPDTFAASGAPPSAPTSVLSPLPSRHHRLRHHAAVVVLTVAHLVAISHADGGRPVGSWSPLVGTAGGRRPHRCRCGRRLLPAEWCA